MAAVPTDAQPFAGDHVVAGLKLDVALADLLVAVEQRERPGSYAGRVLAGLFECGGQDEVGPGREVDGRSNLLLEHADEAVDVVQPVVLDVEAVPTEPGTLRAQDTLGAGTWDIDQGGNIRR